MASIGRRSAGFASFTPNRAQVESLKAKRPAQCNAGRFLTSVESRRVALLEFLAAAARARVVAADVFQRVAHGLLVSVTAIRAVDVAMVVIVSVVVMIVVAVWAMDMGLLGHAEVTLE